MQIPIILFVTLIVFLAVTTLPYLSSWRLALTKHSFSTIIVILTLAMPFIGSIEGAQVGSLISDIPRIVRALLIGILFIVAILSIMQHTESWHMAGTGSKLVIYFFLFCILSAAWSESMFISAWKGFEAFTLALSIISLSRFLKSKNDIKWMLDLISACLLFLSLTIIIGLILYPGDAIIKHDSLYTKNYFAVRGLAPMMNPATIGTLAALLVISAFSSTLISKEHQIKKNNYGLWVVISIGAIDMILGHSRTPIFACAIAIMGLLYFSKKTTKMLIVTLLASLIIIATSAVDFVLSYIYRGQTAETFASLTGRLSFWENHVFKLIADSPIVGHGYYAGFRQVFNVGSLDNSWLAVIAGVGFLGATIFLAHVLYLTINILKTRPRSKTINDRDAYWLIACGFFGILLIRSLTGTSFEVMHPLLTVYMITQLCVVAIIRTDQHSSPDDKITQHSTNNDATEKNNRTIKKQGTRILHSIDPQKNRI